jgi:mono/diheme cytochrome c family protein
MIKRILLSVFFVSFVALYAAAQSDNLAESIKKGKEVYTLNCQSCHMEKGEGLEGAFPPLAKTTYLKDAKKIIGIILNGQTGEITVNGKKYDSAMPGQNYLSDEQIADVLNYVRNNWGNKYPLVTPAQVKAERK